MKKISVVEVQVIIAVPEGSDPSIVSAEVTKQAYDFKERLGDVAQFNILTREVPVQEQPDE